MTNPGDSSVPTGPAGAMVSTATLILLTASLALALVIVVALLLTSGLPNYFDRQYGELTTIPEEYAQLNWEPVNVTHHSTVPESLLVYPSNLLKAQVAMGDTLIEVSSGEEYQEYVVRFVEATDYGPIFPIESKQTANITGSGKIHLYYLLNGCTNTWMSVLTNRTGYFSQTFKATKVCG